MTNHLSSHNDSKQREVYELADALLNRAITAEKAERLGKLVSDDVEARRHYVRFMHDSAALRQWGRDTLDTKQVGPEVPTPSPEPLVPPIILDLSSTNHSLTTNDFVGSWTFACMVATVIMGVMLLGFWAIKVTHHQHIAGTPSKSVPSIKRPEFVFVGRITGLLDVKWSDDKDFLPPHGYAYVPLGHKYKLDSGLMEITYDTGAKVILQGPCTYEVESSSGGYLALGKLTARVGAGDGKGSRSKVQGSMSTSLTTSHQPLATNSNPQSLIPNPLFSIRTPTAVVTDLGTEFGVEVSEEGDTTSHVFRGSVVLVALGDDGKGRGREVTLGENESARVEKPTGGGNPVIVVRPDLVKPESSAFVRRMVEPLRVLDLLDVVAGGNGMGWGRERGIDPMTGMEEPVFWRLQSDGDGQYRPVAWHKLIDGVFVPGSKAGPVQLDSAGHVFDGFPGTDDGRVGGSIWARAATVRPADEREAKVSPYWVYEMGRGEQFMPDRRGLLGLPSNVGITFNLEAMRQAHQDTAPSSFHAVAGMSYGDRIAPWVNGKTDLWVFVDGRLKFKRIGFRRRDGAVKVNVELSPSDRFLTLAVTDGGDGIEADWFVFGDPVLRLASIEAENSGDQGSKSTAQKGDETMNA